MCTRIAQVKRSVSSTITDPSELNPLLGVSSLASIPSKFQLLCQYIYRASLSNASPPVRLISPNAPRGPRNGPTPAVRGGRPHVGPQRGVGSTNPDTRPPRPPRGEGGGGRGGKVRREPKTNDDLDKELEAFMKSPETSDKVSADLEL